MKNIGFYNGTIAPIENLTMPVLDRAVYFGDGVYDALYMRGKKPFALNDHLDRFYSGLEKLEIPFQIPRDDLAGIFFEMIERLDETSDGYTLYWQASRGTAFRNHLFPSVEQSKPNLFIMITPRVIMPVDKTLKLITYPDIRYELCDIKTLNLLPSVLASQRASEKGCDEVAFHRNGTVTECAHNNISILKDGVYRTHPLTNHILPGTTRKHLILHCGELGIPVDETAFTVEEMFAADEIIVTSVGTLCNPVIEIDGKPVGGKAPELLKKLQTAYWERMLRETSK